MCPENTGVVFNAFRDGAEGDTEIQGGEKVSSLLYSQRRKLYVKLRERTVIFRELL